MTRVFFYTLSKEVIHISPPNSLVTSVKCKNWNKKWTSRALAFVWWCFFHSFSRSMACLVIGCTWEDICSQESGVRFFAPFISRWGRKGKYIYHSLQNQMESLLLCTLLYPSLEMVTQSPKRNLQINIAFVVNFFVKNVWNLSGTFFKRASPRFFVLLWTKMAKTMNSQRTLRIGMQEVGKTN